MILRRVVVHKGDIVMFNASLKQQLNNISISGYSSYYINNIQKYVKGNIPFLIKEIKKYVPQAKFPIEVE